MPAFVGRRCSRHRAGAGDGGDVCVPDAAAHARRSGRDHRRRQRHAAQIAEIRERLGLARPILEQFVIWSATSCAAISANRSSSRPRSTELIGQRVGPTLALATVTMIITVLVAVPLGVIAAYKHGSWIDRAGDGLLGDRLLGAGVRARLSADLLASRSRSGCSRSRATAASSTASGRSCTA